MQQYSKEATKFAQAIQEPEPLSATPTQDEVAAYYHASIQAYGAKQHHDSQFADYTEIQSVQNQPADMHRIAIQVIWTGAAIVFAAVVVATVKAIFAFAAANVALIGGGWILAIFLLFVASGLKTSGSDSGHSTLYGSGPSQADNITIIQQVNINQK